MRHLPHTLRLAAASLLLLTACAGAQQSPPAPTDTAPATATDPAGNAGALWQQIKQANADQSCDNSSQCHTIGIGAKACGGPENYLAWSSKNNDGAKLKSLVELHSAARRADDKRQHMMSTCSVVSDPGATCRAGVCVLNARNPANPGGPNLQ
ncbi:hypothetical protein [Duganella callida]|uniref:DUF4189 domain-containing protein n=1 Tax=Duganella callida TaxID=2561932 RepID=A0A4Y9SU07_9BURK|nr:hypothetical protein [Duganella callida]TFW29945.1 hypothetical protein E4L98_03030 [Duganella callida]